MPNEAEETVNLVPRICCFAMPELTEVPQQMMLVRLYAGVLLGSEVLYLFDLMVDN